MVMANMGIGVMPDCAVQTELQQGKQELFKTFMKQAFAQDRT